MKNTILFLGFLYLSLNYTYGQKILKASLLIDAKAGVGDGAMWYPTEKMFYWVDMDAKTLHSYNPASKVTEMFELGKMTGTVAPIDTGGVLLGVSDGVYSFNTHTKTMKLLVAPETGMPNNWLNDGKCDPSGRFWVGSMGPKNKASLYRVNAEGQSQNMLDSITISNGIVWSNDKTKMYYIDTPSNEVKQFDYNDKTGSIANKKVVVKFPDGVGSPDGMAIDTKGNLWIAHWGGSCVSCWDPKTGEMIAKVEVPALNVTSCAFGGENLETLYITTTSLFMDESSQKKFPLRGGIFMVNTGAKGLPANYFKTN